MQRPVVAMNSRNTDFNICEQKITKIRHCIVLQIEKLRW